ncbi:MAG: type I restriction enzyme HsdR N-terminal domain-containing protein [Bacteroidota bacterium]
MLLRLDLLKYQSKLNVSGTGDNARVFDPIRKKYVALAPEEHLRQLFLLYLLEEKKYAPGRIRSEIGIEVNGMKKRCDIVVFDAQINPWLLVECKSPHVELTQSVFEQAAVYNLRLRAPYLAITNGLATYCCALDFERSGFRYLDGLPDIT